MMGLQAEKNRLNHLQSDVERLEQLTRRKSWLKKSDGKRKQHIDRLKRKRAEATMQMRMVMALESRLKDD